MLNYKNALKNQTDVFTTPKINVTPAKLHSTSTLEDVSFQAALDMILRDAPNALIPT